MVPADQDKITAARMMMDEEAMLSKLPISLAKIQSICWDVVGIY